MAAERDPDWFKSSEIVRAYVAGASHEELVAQVLATKPDWRPEGASQFLGWLFHGGCIVNEDADGSIVPPLEVARGRAADPRVARHSDWRWLGKVALAQRRSRLQKTESGKPS